MNTQTQTFMPPTPQAKANLTRLAHHAHLVTRIESDVKEKLLVKFDKW